MPLKFFVKTPRNEVQVISKGNKLVQRMFPFYSRFPICNQEKITSMSRFMSFENGGVSQHFNNKYIESLVESGFYFCDVSATLKCYLCGLEVRNFEIIKNPFEFHFRLNSSCSHIVLAKGPNFIDNLKNNLLKNFAESNSIKVLDKSSDFLCTVCKTNGPEILILPCKHFTTCGECTSNLFLCPICRSTIKSFTFIYTVEFS